jgi:hypothetical protein
MQRRLHERIPARLDVRLFCGSLITKGIVTNLSENGMFISTEMCFPVNSVLEMIVLLKREVLKFPIKVRRTVKIEDSSNCNGMGVELLSPPPTYLKFVKELKSVM